MVSPHIAQTIRKRLDDRGDVQKLFDLIEEGKGPGPLALILDIDPVHILDVTNRHST
jgi:hypothetical protein